MPCFNILKSLPLGVRSRSWERHKKDDTKSVNYLKRRPSSSASLQGIRLGQVDESSRSQYDAPHRLPQHFEQNVDEFIPRVTSASLCFLQEKMLSNGAIQNTFTQHDGDTGSSRSWSPMPSVHRETSEQGHISKDSLDLELVNRTRRNIQVEGYSDDFKMMDAGSRQAPRSSVLGEWIKDGRRPNYGRGTTLDKNRQPSRPPVRRLTSSYRPVAI